MNIDVSVVICNYNRCNDVLRAIESTLAQTGVALEVLVMDDASTDTTVSAVRSQYPDVRIRRSDTNLGYIKQRNLSLGLATGRYIVFLDNDAYFSATGTLADVVAHLDFNPEVAAISIPFLEPWNDVGLNTATALPNCVQQVRSFVGCASCLSRATAIDIGGFREEYEHYCEEKDLAIRLLEAGYKTEYIQRVRWST